MMHGPNAAVAMRARKIAKVDSAARAEPARQLNPEAHAYGAWNVNRKMLKEIILNESCQRHLSYDTRKGAIHVLHLVSTLRAVHRVRSLLHNDQAQRPALAARLR